MGRVRRRVLARQTLKRTDGCCKQSMVCYCSRCELAVHCLTCGCDMSELVGVRMRRSISSFVERKPEAELRYAAIAADVPSGRPAMLGRGTLFYDSFM